MTCTRNTCTLSLPQVKDRFCTLLSQQVAELQQKMSDLQSAAPTDLNPAAAAALDQSDSLPKVRSRGAYMVA